MIKRNEKSIIVDAQSFIRNPREPKQILRNAHMVEFCISAIEHGYEVSIVYHDYDSLYPKRPDPNAKSLAVQALSRAIEDYKKESATLSFNPEFLMKRLASYSDYQRGYKRKYLVRDKKDNQDRTPERSHPLDKVDIIVSPHQKSTKGYNNSFGMRFGDYELYVPTSSINSFKSFTDISQNLNSTRYSNNKWKQTALTDTMNMLSLAQDKLTIEDSFQDAGFEIIAAIREHQAIVSFLKDKPENEQEFASDETTSKEDQNLRSYFAALIRAQKFPDRAITHEEDASYILQGLQEQNGDEAAEAIKKAVKDLSPILTPAPPQN